MTLDSKTPFLVAAGAAHALTGGHSSLKVSLSDCDLRGAWWLVVVARGGERWRVVAACVCTLARASAAMRGGGFRVAFCSETPRLRRTASPPARRSYTTHGTADDPVSGPLSNQTVSAETARGFTNGFEYYGTFFRAMYTLFQASLDLS